MPEAGAFLRCGPRPGGVHSAFGAECVCLMLGRRQVVCAVVLNRSATVSPAVNRRLPAPA
jgi:hypothetical protein